jgi:hypothetical protein
MRAAPAVVVAIVTLSVGALAQPSDGWQPFQFLLGTWVGEGGGGPGEGAGEFSIAFDLNRQILVRKNFSEYPAQNGRPAYRHDDLLITYIDSATKAPRAIYFDSEGHTIRYAIAVRDRSLVYESEPGEAFPHYRFTYVPNGESRIKGTFEIAADRGSPFKSYIEFTARKKQ